MDWFDSAREQLAQWKLREKAAQDYVQKFTPRSQLVMRCARELALRRGHNFIGTEHLLLGIMASASSTSSERLAAHGLTIEAVNNYIKEQYSSGSAVSWPTVSFTPRVKKVLHYAEKEAVATKCSHVGTEHLLLGLLKETEGPAAAVFRHFKVDCEHLREELLQSITAAWHG